jgi:RNA polymerase sigma-70 factor, ECF subfamily
MSALGAFATEAGALASHARVPLPFTLQALPTNASAHEAKAESEARPLLPRVSLGDELATRECLQRYGNLVWSLARKYAASRAEDATQEVFLELWKHADRFDPARGSEVTFVAMLARRRLVDARRAELRIRKRHAANEVEVLHVSEVVEANLEWTPDARIAVDVLRELPLIQQQAITLSVVDQASHGEIAESLNLPLGSVKSYIRRGLDAIRTRVEARRTPLSPAKETL